MLCLTICLCISPDLDGYRAPKNERFKPGISNQDSACLMDCLHAHVAIVGSQTHSKAVGHVTLFTDSDIVPMQLIAFEAVSSDRSVDLTLIGALDHVDISTASAQVCPLLRFSIVCIFHLLYLAPV
jgi:hypothetical protein